MNDGVCVGDNDDYYDGHDDRDDDDHDLVSNAASAVLHFQGKCSQADKESQLSVCNGLLS